MNSTNYKSCKLEIKFLKKGLVYLKFSPNLKKEKGGLQTKLLKIRNVLMKVAENNMDVIFH